MKKDLKIKESIVVNTTANRLWDVLTQPDLIQEYLYGTRTSSDWIKGSEIVFEGEYNGQKYRDHGKITESIKNEKIAYSYWTGFSGLEDKPENYALITYEIKVLKENEIEFSWIQEGFSSEENYNHAAIATKNLVAQIKEIAERK